jgi:hypothetical protein
MNQYPVYSLTQALDRLSPRARRKYDDLKGAVADAEALQRSLMERIRAKEEQLARLANRRDTTAEAAESVKLDREMAAARIDLDKLERERSRRNSVRANTEQICSRLDKFIMQWFSGAEDTAPPSWPTTVSRARDGESLTDALLRIRSEIAAALGSLAAVRVAPLPASEIRAALVADVDRMAEAGAPRISIANRKITVHWPDVQPYAVSGAALSAPSGSASALECYLRGDEVKQRLTAAITDLQGSIPSSEWPQRLRAAEATVFALEVAEERLVMAALDAGLEVHRRIDASPWAILYSGANEEAARAEAAE